MPTTGCIPYVWAYIIPLVSAIYMYVSGCFQITKKTYNDTCIDKTASLFSERSVRSGFRLYQPHFSNYQSLFPMELGFPSLVVSDCASDTNKCYTGADTNQIKIGDIFRIRLYGNAREEYCLSSPLRATFQRRLNGRDVVSNHRCCVCLLGCFIRQNNKGPSHRPLLGEFTGERRILRTKGQ